MQDEIQEIMELVDEYANACEHELAATYHGTVSYGDSGMARKTIESKLRELVREPLSHELAWSIAVISDTPLDAIRKAERAHGISKEGGE